MLLDTSSERAADIAAAVCCCGASSAVSQATICSVSAIEKHALCVSHRNDPRTGAHVSTHYRLLTKTPPTDPSLSRSSTQTFAMSYSIASCMSFSKSM